MIFSWFSWLFQRCTWFFEWLPVGSFTLLVMPSCGSICNNHTRLIIVLLCFLDGMYKLLSNSLIRFYSILLFYSIQNCRGKTSGAWERWTVIEMLSYITEYKVFIQLSLSLSCSLDPVLNFNVWILRILLAGLGFIIEYSYQVVVIFLMSTHRLTRRNPAVYTIFFIFFTYSFFL